MEQSKKNIDIMEYLKTTNYYQSTNYQSNSSKGTTTKYFNFPQEIIFAQLNSYKMKIQRNKIELMA